MSVIIHVKYIPTECVEKYLSNFYWVSPKIIEEKVDQRAIHPVRALVTYYTFECKTRHLPLQKQREKTYEWIHQPIWREIENERRRRPLVKCLIR